MLAGAKSSLFRMGKEEKCGKRESELAAGLLIARGALVGARVGAEGGGGALVVVVVVVVGGGVGGGGGGGGGRVKGCRAGLNVTGGAAGAKGVTGAAWRGCLA